MKHKLLLFIVLTLVFVFCSSLIAFASESVEYEAAYELVSEVGFPVDKMDIETLMAIYSDIKDADKVVTETTTEYLTVTSDGKIIQRGNISSSDLTLSITAGKNVVNEQIVGVTVFVWYEWANYKPIILMTDAISVNWPDVLTFEAGSFTAKHYSSVGTLKQSLTNPSKSNQEGLGWYITLSFSEDGSGPGSYGNGHFTLSPADPMEDGQDHAGTVNVEYGHRRLAGSLTLSTSGPGVTIINANDTAAASYTFRYN